MYNIDDAHVIFVKNSLKVSHFNKCSSGSVFCGSAWQSANARVDAEFGNTIWGYLQIGLNSAHAEG